MKLGTHEERMAALEECFEYANTATERVQIIHVASQLDNDYRNRRAYESGNLSNQSLSTATNGQGYN